MTRPKWEFGLTLDPRSARPLFLQIATAIADDISRGRLKPGDPLPGTRTLAASLGVNRITVLTAYDELAAEGWIVTRRARGAWVAAAQRGQGEPRARRERRGDGSEQNAGLPPAIYALPDIPKVPRWPAPRRGLLLLNSAPDTRLLRVEPLARAYRRVLRRHGGAVLAYGDPKGHPTLREGIAQMLAVSRGMTAAPGEIIVTRGSQMGLSLVARGLLRPGQLVAVEAPGYPHAWQTFRLAGAKLAPIPVDAEGIDVRAIERLASSRAVAAVYVTPHHQFPTTVTMSPARRAQLLALAASRRFVVVEDDYDDAFHYEGRPVMPLASLDRSGVVVYVGTFSKVFAPGLRMGYVVAPPAVLERLAAHREFLDIHGDSAMEAAMAELLDESEVQRHVLRVKRVYHRRRDLLAELLTRELGDALEFEMPAGGVAFWVRVARGIDVDEWATRALEKGAAFLTARRFAFDGKPGPFARFGFASLDEHELREAVKRLVSSRPPSDAARRLLIPERDRRID